MSKKKSIRVEIPEGYYAQKKLDPKGPLNYWIEMVIPAMTKNFGPPTKFYVAKNEGIFSQFENIVYDVSTVEEAKILNLILQSFIENQTRPFLSYYLDEMTIEQYVQNLKIETTVEEIPFVNHHDPFEIMGDEILDTWILTAEMIRKMKNVPTDFNDLIAYLQGRTVLYLEPEQERRLTDNRQYWFYQVALTLLSTIEPLNKVLYFHRYSYGRKKPSRYTQLMDEGAIVIRASRYSEAMIINRILRAIIDDISYLTIPGIRTLTMEKMTELIKYSNELIRIPGFETETYAVYNVIFPHSLVFDRFNIEKLLLDLDLLNLKPGDSIPFLMKRESWFV